MKLNDTELKGVGLIIKELDFRDEAQRTHTYCFTGDQCPRVLFVGQFEERFGERTAETFRAKIQVPVEGVDITLDVDFVFIHRTGFLTPLLNNPGKFILPDALTFEPTPMTFQGCRFAITYQLPEASEWRDIPMDAPIPQDTRLIFKPRP